jgi:hypothetical protein
MMTKENLPKIILVFIGIAVLTMGITLLFIPPALFPDPANGFQVLRSMQLGGGFNNMVAPDQSDISQDYTEFLTWWSPGQYLIPWLFKLITGLSQGRGIAIVVFLSSVSGLGGFYLFFARLHFLCLMFITTGAKFYFSLSWAGFYTAARRCKGPGLNWYCLCC